MSLFLPPFGFVTLAVLALFWPRFRLRLIAVSLIGLVLLAMPVVADRLQIRLEENLPRTPPASAPPGAILVLGAEIRRTSDNDAHVVGRLSLERLLTAAHLQRRTGLPVLISGGTMQPSQPAIGAVMADTMEQDFAIPVRWRELRSRDTWENALYSAEILRKEGITSVYVVTHAWHMRRTLLAFQQTGLTVTAAPTPPDKRDGAILDDFIPRTSTWMVSYYALHEWIGYAWYTFR